MLRVLYLFSVSAVGAKEQRGDASPVGNPWFGSNGGGRGLRAPIRARSVPCSPAVDPRSGRMAAIEGEESGSLTVIRLEPTGIKLGGTGAREGSLLLVF